MKIFLLEELEYIIQYKMLTFFSTMTLEEIKSTQIQNPLNPSIHPSLTETTEVRLKHGSYYCYHCRSTGNWSARVRGETAGRPNAACRNICESLLKL